MNHRKFNPRSMEKIWRSFRKLQRSMESCWLTFKVPRIPSIFHIYSKWTKMKSPRMNLLNSQISSMIFGLLFGSKWYPQDSIQDPWRKLEDQSENSKDPWRASEIKSKIHGEHRKLNPRSMENIWKSFRKLQRSMESIGN